jgi:hypothetical protein
MSFTEQKEADDFQVRELEPRLIGCSFGFRTVGGGPCYLYSHDLFR